MRYFTVEPGDAFQVAFLVKSPTGRTERTAWQAVHLQGDMAHTSWPTGSALPLERFLHDCMRRLTQAGFLATSPTMQVKTHGQVWFITTTEPTGEGEAWARIARGFGPEGRPRQGFEQLPTGYRSMADVFGYAIREIKDRARDPHAEQVPTRAN